MAGATPPLPPSGPMALEPLGEDTRTHASGEVHARRPTGVTLSQSQHITGEKKALPSSTRFDESRRRVHMI